MAASVFRLNKMARTFSSEISGCQLSRSLLVMGVVPGNWRCDAAYSRCRVCFRSVVDDASAAMSSSASRLLFGAEAAAEVEAASLVVVTAALPEERAEEVVVLAEELAEELLALAEQMAEELVALAEELELAVLPLVSMFSRLAAGCDFVSSGSCRLLVAADCSLQIGQLRRNGSRDSLSL